MSIRKKAQSRARKKLPKGGRWKTAATSDPQLLYEKSVQDPQGEVDFIDQVWHERRGRVARSLREDFCASALAAVTWVKHRRTNIAYAVDLDPVVLDWARARLAKRLTPSQRRRITFIQSDVLHARVPRVDTVVAMNFSSFVFKTRETMRAYFRSVHRGLNPGGLFILDAYGGSESFEEMEEEKDFDGFTYVWDQALYNPITGEVINHIHYRFPDGSEINKAFTYDWRLWTLPELQEMLVEAGFHNPVVYWEGTDAKTGEGDGEFNPSTRGEACAGWVAYVVAEKSRPSSRRPNRSRP